MIAVVVKHMFRSCDYRVDLFPDAVGLEEALKIVQLNLIGPFEVIAATKKVSEYTAEQIEDGRANIVRYAEGSGDE